MRLLGIDPGRTTGICIANDNDGLIVEHVEEVLWDDRFMFLSLLRTLADASGPLQLSAIVVESFHLYQHRAKQQVGSDFPSVQVIGIVEAAAFLYASSTCPIIYQPASSIARTEVLPQHKLSVGGSEHTKDAYKHVRYYWECNVKRSGTSALSSSSNGTRRNKQSPNR